jgi:adenylate cyclase
MATEIERKFLVTDTDWKQRVNIESSSCIEQGYLCAEGALSVRIRLRDGDATLTIKGPSEGIQRREYEYPVPADDAAAMLQLCGNRRISKYRHIVKNGALEWEIDEFSGRNAGLVVAEIELEYEKQPFGRPPWLGEEVSNRPEYYNANLARKSVCEWDQ